MTKSIHIVICHVGRLGELRAQPDRALRRRSQLGRGMAPPMQASPRTLRDLHDPELEINLDREGSGARHIGGTEASTCVALDLADAFGRAFQRDTIGLVLATKLEITPAST